MRLIPYFLIVAAPLCAQQPRGDQFTIWDKNSDGKLVPAELPERLRPNFGRVDTDGDGFITPKEHREFLAKRGPQQPAGGAPQAKLPDSVEVRKNLDYAGGGNPRQMLDLVLPKKRDGGGKLPLIVFIHGGGWRNGSKEGTLGRLVPFVETGEYAGATLNYRLTGESKWPTQIHDCKAAIRYLRGNAEKFGIDPKKIAVWGSSAGGHLVSMLGTSGGVKELEGELGEFDAQSPYPPTFKDARVETYRKIDSTELKSVMKKAGRPCKLVGYDGADHGFFNRNEHFTKTLAEADGFLVDLGWIKK